MAGRLDVGQAVRDADDRLAAVGHLAEQLHHLAVGLLVESGGDLVEEQQARPRHQLVGQARPLHLPAAQVPDQHVPPAGQADHFQDVGDARLELVAGEVRRQPELGRIAKRRAGGQRVVQHVLLRHDGDVFLEGLEIGVEVLAVHRHGPARRRVPAAQDREQRRLARTARAEQADELPGPDDQADVGRAASAACPSPGPGPLAAARGRRARCCSTATG